KSFRSDCVLNSHIRKVHHGKPYACLTCGEQFDTKALLKEHIVTEHFKKQNRLPLRYRKSSPREQMKTI
ncbi:hypothetical protein PMAYCL1PPCAC_08298, partial [Pristionchus mayeri]